MNQSSVSISSKRNAFGKWVVRYYSEDGGRPSKSFDRLEDARDYKRQLERQMEGGSLVDTKKARITLDDYIEHWLSEWLNEHPEPRTNTLTAIGQAHRVMRAHEVVKLPLNAVTKKHLLDLQAFMLDDDDGLGLAASSVATHWIWVQAIFRRAVEVDRLLTKSPCADVRKPDVEHDEIVVPEWDEIIALTDRLPDDLAAIPRLGATSGLRPAEMFGLEVDKVTWLSKEPTLLVRKQVVQGELVNRLKTKRSRRDVPVAQETVDLLSEHLARVGRTARDAGLIFRGPDGVSPVWSTSVRYQWDKALRDAGIATRPTQDGRERQLRIHDMRHFYATTLIEDGHGSIAVAKRLGNTAGETERTYAHLFKQNDDKVRGTMSALFRPGPVQSSEAQS